MMVDSTPQYSLTDDAITALHTFQSLMDDESLPKTYHEIGQSREKLSDLADGRGLVEQPVAVAVEDDLLQVLEVGVMDERAEIGAVRRRDCGLGRRRTRKRKEKKAGSSL